MDDCIFCKIAKGEVSAEKVYEDEDTLAFLDNNPKVPSHTLLIPKKHYMWFEEMPDELSDKVFRVAKRIAKDMKREPGVGYVQLSIVGKDVPHAHVHLLPQQGTSKATAL
ncbi:MAG: HIT domain-containing protein [Candidatus Adlerbacteria bacterium]|nr:HIT domain-containing protein [Candidatus Adlerbacteria bacterium]